MPKFAHQFFKTIAKPSKLNDFSTAALDEELDLDQYFSLV
jgi:hypothetical protein